MTAGVGNAIDVAKSYENNYPVKTGLRNYHTWVFIDGELTEEAFIQSIMTATEAKVKVLHDREVRNPDTGTLATGTSTDSIMIAATQKGESLEFARYDYTAWKIDWQGQSMNVHMTPLRKAAKEGPDL